MFQPGDDWCDLPEGLVHYLEPRLTAVVGTNRGSKSSIFSIGNKYLAIRSEYAPSYMLIGEVVFGSTFGSLARTRSTSGKRPGMNC